jgi:dipeptidyl aminopeptidase/acylaminoacyl peptidase
MTTDAPFGLWPSPLTPQRMAGAARISDAHWDSDGRHVVWLESRAGRSVLVCVDTHSADAPRDLTPPDMAVRARVGYGGGEFCVGHGQAFFVEGASGRIFRTPLSGGAAHPITPAFGNAAAPTLSPDGHWLLYVHTYEDEDCLAIVDSAGRHWPQRLVVGHDFFMQPCWHPAGDRIAYVAWDHPFMAWDSSRLYLATLDRSGLLPQVRNTRIVAGGADSAVFQPAFAPDGRHLAFVADTSGYPQLYLYDLQHGENRRITADEAEYSQPAFIQGLRSYAWRHDSQALYTLPNQQATRRLSLLTVADATGRPLLADAEYRWFNQPAASPRGPQLTVIASSDRRPDRLLLIDGDRVRILRRSSDEIIQPDQLATAHPVTMPAADGATVHGLLYLPPGYDPTQAGPRPPAIVRVHGGPTDQTTLSFRSQAQFFATRGYVVLEVNYRGSSGYGRAYMQALGEQWGILDVTDSIAAADYLEREAIADAQRLVIMGSSAGGYTVLEALCRAPGRFRAAICSYGVSNLFSLAADTHKFELHYLDQLIGPLPETAERYRERSPIFHPERLRDPIALFQGEDDQIVPRDQSDSIVAELRRRGVPHIYQLYPGEGHGWRKPETITAFYRSVEEFLRQYVIYG